jgi:hypothetical protein
MAMTRWSQVDNTDKSSAAMNHGKKRGGIKYPICVHGREGDEVLFELVPEHEHHEKARPKKLSWSFFRKRS